MGMGIGIGIGRIVRDDWGSQEKGPAARLVGDCDSFPKTQGASEQLGMVGNPGGNSD